MSPTTRRHARLWPGPSQLWGLFPDKNPPQENENWEEICPPVNYHNYGKSRFLKGKSTISTGPFSIAFCMFTGGLNGGFLWMVHVGTPSSIFVSSPGDQPSWRRAVCWFIKIITSIYITIVYISLYIYSLQLYPPNSYWKYSGTNLAVSSLLLLGRLAKGVKRCVSCWILERTKKCTRSQTKINLVTLW